MITDVKGKVKNLKLAPSQRLIPVLEAIVNSIQACPGKASLKLELKRQETQISTDLESEKFQEIEEFCIIDEGIGFTPDNLQSFKTADSTFKSKIGCKGVGRFTWLKVFESVEIESVYKENEDFSKINFCFSIADPDIESISKKLCDSSVCQSRTSVTLRNPKAPFQQKLPISIFDIADEILEHCLMYFLEEKISSFELSSNTNEKIDLIEYFKTNFNNSVDRTEFKTGNQKFKAYYIRNYGRQRTHKINFCANSRSVSTFKPTDYLENIPSYFNDEDGKAFRYSIFIASTYLDDNVNQERTSFSIARTDELKDEDHPCIDSIIGELIIDCNGVFLEYFQPMLDQHRARVQSYVDHTGYEYRHVVKHKSEWVDKIRVGVSDEQLDIELHKLSRDFESELKTEANGIKKKLKESKSLSTQEYRDAYKKYSSAINDVGKSNLAKYITHRKSIIDLFGMSLDLQTNDKYALESAVHDIVLPLSSTSDDITNLSQNLWLIDERMSYHTLLSSDTRFDSVTNIPDASRPDVMLFNNPIVFGDDERQPKTATIIEFKRPMRAGYTEVDNPVKQVMDYAKKLRNTDKIETTKGRPLQLSKTVPIYCYIVCDLTRSIRDYCSDHSYTPTSDNNGFIWYHEGYNIYFEILSFDKVLEDAKMRNNVLFRMLNLQ